MTTTTGAIKATRNSGPQDPETRPAGARGLAFAVLALGLEEAVKGERDAWDWLGSDAFEFWCDRCGMQPDYLRRQVAQRAERPGKRLSLDEFDIERAAALYRSGLTMRKIAEEFGVSQSNVRYRLWRAGHVAGKG